MESVRRLIPIFAALSIVIGLVAWGVIGGVVVNELTHLAPTQTGTPTAPRTEIAIVPAIGTPTDPPLVFPSATPAPTDTPTDTPPPDPQITPSQTPPPSVTPLPLIVIMPTLPPTPTLILLTATAYPTTPPTPAPPTLPPNATVIVVTGEPAAAPPAQAECLPPPGWTAYQVQPGDTLFGFQLGAEGKVDVQTIMAGNCLNSKFLTVGQVIFLPTGAGEAAPKLDDLSGEPDVQSRPSACPCTITVRPGHRLEQIAANIDKLPAGFTGRDFLTATGPAANVGGYWFLADKPGGKSLEGFMFPGTYTIEKDMTAAGFRDMLLNAFGANVGQDLAGAAAGRGMTFWQAVNLASIVQRESYDANEQKMVASVMHNRMAAGKGIASSVTLQYAFGAPGAWWPNVFKLNFNTDSPYNTNRYKGFPPTPISNPGLSAILAAVYPAQTDYQYFNTKCGGGGNFYARTFEEFKQGLICN